MAWPSSAICRMRLRRTETAANSAATYSAVIATIEVTTSKGVITSAARARTREPGAGSRRRHSRARPPGANRSTSTRGAPAPPSVTHQQGKVGRAPNHAASASVAAAAASVSGPGGNEAARR